MRVIGSIVSRSRPEKFHNSVVKAIQTCNFHCLQIGIPTYQRKIYREAINSIVKHYPLVDINVTYMPKRFDNKVPSLLKKNIEVIRGTFQPSEDYDIIVKFDDTSDMSGKFTPVIRKFENPRIMQISGFASIYGLFHENSKGPRPFYISPTIAGGVIAQRSRMFDFVMYDTDMNYMEDADLDFQLIREFGYQSRLIYRDWTFKSIRHVEGGTDNSLKMDYHEMDRHVKRFNKKWGGNYCSMHMDKYGIFSLRRKYAKFLKDMGQK